MSSIIYTGLGELQEPVEMDLRGVSWLLPSGPVGLCLWGRLLSKILPPEVTPSKGQISMIPGQRAFPPRGDSPAVEEVRP